MNKDTPVQPPKKTNVRWLIVLILFLVGTINFAERSTISIAGPVMSEELNIDPVSMGYIFSAFGWSYTFFQLPGGWLLDKFGSNRVYAVSIFFRSIFALLQNTVIFFSGTAAVVVLFCLRFLIGAAEAPTFPANSRIVATWFPSSERGTASAIFSSAQYFATVIFAPLMGWIVYSFGWNYVFAVIASLAFCFVFIWRKFVHDPKDHPYINEAELNYLEAGGALTNMDQDKKNGGKTKGPDLHYIVQLLKNRMILGVYIAQYCVASITYFFITWFLVYLVQERGMTVLTAGFAVAVPAIFGCIGGISGGLFSDFLLRKGYSLSIARKIPVVFGMILCASMIFCNYVDSQQAVVGIMALSFFGKAFGGIGWVVNSDTAPKQIVGLCGSLMNTIANLASIVTPIVIGYIVQNTGSFHSALIYVTMHALAVIVIYVFVVGEIKRVELK